MNEYVEDDIYESTCPACGEYIEYCQGHGESGDNAGWTILNMHDNDIHDRCHENSDCQLKEEN